MPTEIRLWSCGLKQSDTHVIIKCDHSIAAWRHWKVKWIGYMEGIIIKLILELINWFGIDNWMGNFVSSIFPISSMVTNPVTCPFLTHYLPTITWGFFASWRACVMLSIPPTTTAKNESHKQDL